MSTTNENFQEILEKDESLVKLLDQKDINIFTNFSKANYSEEFKEYISKRYYDAFEEIYTKNIGTETAGKITSLLRSVEFLSTYSTRDKIIDLFLPTLEKAHNDLEAFKQYLNNEDLMIKNGDLLDESLTPIIVNIFNKFDSYESVKEYKIKILTSAFDICDAVASANPKKFQVKYATYNAVMNNIEKVYRFETLKGRFEQHSSRISKKRTGVEVKYIIWVVIVVLLILFRILRHLD
jgi:hypothetical protein